MTRIQQERFTDPVEYEKVKNVYSLNASMLSGVRPNMKILHPLPRLQEIAVDVFQAGRERNVRPHGHHLILTR